MVLHGAVLWVETIHLGRKLVKTWDTKGRWTNRMLYGGNPLRCKTLAGRWNQTVQGEVKHPTLQGRSLSSGSKQLRSFRKSLKPAGLLLPGHMEAVRTAGRHSQTVCKRRGLACWAAYSSAECPGVLASMSPLTCAGVSNFMIWLFLKVSSGPVSNPSLLCQSVSVNKPSQSHWFTQWEFGGPCFGLSLVPIWDE